MVNVLYVLLKSVQSLRKKSLKDDIKWYHFGDFIVKIEQIQLVNQVGNLVFLFVTLTYFSSMFDLYIS